MQLKDGWLAEDLKAASERVAAGFPTPREGRLESALKDIAELAIENGAEWAASRAHTALLAKR